MPIQFMDLARKRCKPCEGGTKPMNKAEARKNLKFAEGWRLKGNSIYTELRFKDFRNAMGFVNRVADIAESDGHHPDILVYSWNRVRLTNSTHAIKGLSINDFILAAKINQIK
ncbi:TPA: 4a-hydroxytetrahydrobiopterin dehydratase [Candidatus Micrarchaeota archaeon]|nr:4a-hydroxytetrahydrobiopterin dehydratase [Candidatus Micrarchaeota archaeon]